MENLTYVLLNNHYHYEVEEWTKQGQAIQFDDGTEQRIVGASIPAVELTIMYKGISQDKYEFIRRTYEDNHSNTFIVDLDSFIDKRPDLMGIDASVWAFKSFEFSISARDMVFDGKVTLITSVFFNFDEYQNLFSQSSGYTAIASTNTQFIDLLDDVPPYQVTQTYYNNALFSNIGESVRHIKNKGGLKKTWKMSWLLTESQFIQLLTFYRKKSGMMGNFGINSTGFNSTTIENYFIADDYIEDYLLYDDWYIEINSEENIIHKGRFMQDSFKYQKRVDGLYTCQADFVEIK